MITREAHIKDWEKLFIFFSRIYRVNHPLQNQEFWNWQYGNPEFGRSFICLNDKDEIVGHVGANFGGGLAWIINVYLDAECRGKGVLSQLYGLARNYFPLGATAANEAGLGLYRNMRWHRHHDLVRYVKINPSIHNPKFEYVCETVDVKIEHYINKDSHYFQQPGIQGLKFSDGSQAINQSEVGGLRVVDIVDLNLLESISWQNDYNWMDYISSWNDLKNKDLEKNGWILDTNSVVPWRLNPLEKGSFCDITYLSEEPLHREFIVHRSYSDHGRIGSL